MALAAILTASMVTPALAGDEVIVQSGDTLWDLAQRHGTTVASLVALNQIQNPSVIRIGQRIVLRPPAATSAPAPAPAASEPVIYVVRSGDTLWDIALRHGTTVTALAELNKLANPSIIRIGQALAISHAVAPPPAVTPAPLPAAPDPARVIHTVQAGETLWVISGRYGVSIQSIVDTNQLASAGFIRTGQQLVIPTAAGGAAPSPSSVTIAGMPAAMAAAVAARAASRDLLVAAAREFAVPEAFVLAVSWHESGWQPGVVSSAGAVGLMQLMPDTADWVAGTMLHEAPAMSDARWNARAGVRLLAFYLSRYQSDKAKTLAAYFQGMGSVDQIGILVSSQPYIDSITALEAMFSR
jgi:LysM repeat protein